METYKAAITVTWDKLRGTQGQEQRLWECEDLVILRTIPYRQEIEGSNHGARYALPASIMAANNGRRCIVTGGATVAFRELSDEVLKPDFLKALANNGFTHLDVQCGKYFDELKEKLTSIDTFDIRVTCFPFDKNLKSRFAALRGGLRDGGNERVPSGCVISHAATGTVLDVYPNAVPMIVVANPNLMDNHQDQFATHVATKLPLIIQGQLGEIHKSIPKVMELIDHWKLDYLPPYRAPAFPMSEEERMKVFDWMLLECYEPDCLENAFSHFIAGDPEKVVEFERQVAQAQDAGRQTGWGWVPRSITRFFW